MFIDFILSLHVTVLVYTVPILILRFAILKGSLRKKKAVGVVILWGVIGAIIIMIIQGLLGGKVGVGPATVLWGTVNFFILTSGRLIYKERAYVDVKEYVITWAQENIQRNVAVNREYLEKVSDLFCEKAKERMIGGLSLYDHISDEPTRVKADHIKSLWEESEREINIGQTKM